MFVYYLSSLNSKATQASRKSSLLLEKQTVNSWTTVTPLKMIVSSIAAFSYLLSNTGYYYAY